MMRIIARKTLAAFSKKHPNARISLDHWSSIAEMADWSDTNDIRATFPKAKVLNGERVRFEIGGGNHRLVVAFKFKRRLCFVKFLGTHAEYDRIDALEISQY